MGLVVLVFQVVLAVFHFLGVLHHQGVHHHQRVLHHQGVLYHLGVFLFLDTLYLGCFLYLVVFHLYPDNVFFFQNVFVCHVIYYNESHYHPHQDIPSRHCGFSSNFWYMSSSSCMDRKRTIQLQQYVRYTRSC